MFSNSANGSEEELARLRQLLAEKDREISLLRSVQNFYDPMTSNALKTPVIASDTQVYELTDYDDMLSKRNDSPFTHHDFRPSPYPFVYKKLQQHLRNPTDFHALSELCVDPVTGVVMQAPYIATLKIYVSGELKDGVIVCDKSTLEVLAYHDPVKVVNSREYRDLKDLIIVRQEELNHASIPARGLDFLTSGEFTSEYFSPVRPSGNFHVLGTMLQQPLVTESFGWGLPARSWTDPANETPRYSAPSQGFFADKDAGSNAGARCDTPGCESNPRITIKPGFAGG